MSGGVMSGYWATGQARRATPPMMMVTMEITIATIGRRMKKLPMAYFPPAGGRPARRGAAGFGTTVIPSRSRWRCPPPRPRRRS